MIRLLIYTSFTKRITIYQVSISAKHDVRFWESKDEPDFRKLPVFRKLACSFHSYPWSLLSASHGGAAENKPTGTQPKALDVSRCKAT